MSFDISKLTIAVNKYLNSISEISSLAERTQQEIADRTQFSTELSSAIRENIESRMRDRVTMPDLGSLVQDRAVQSVGAEDRVTQAGIAQDKAIKASALQGKDAQGNGDAYNGALSAQALQDLSKSRYFSANLIQDSLFKEDDGSGSSDSGTGGGYFGTAGRTIGNSYSGTGNSSISGTSPFDTVSLSDLNTNSLLANALTSGTQIPEITGSADLAKALISAYKSTPSAVSPTSIFGDFSL